MVTINKSKLMAEVIASVSIKRALQTAGAVAPLRIGSPALVLSFIEQELT